MGGTLFIFLLTITHLAVLLNSINAVNPKKGFSIRMIHRDSKESPLYPGDHLTRDERLQRLVEQSKSQAHYIESQVLLQSNATHSANPDVARLPVVYEPHMSYVAMVGLGTFPRETPTFKNYYLMIDSSSDQTWLQCDGATEFFRQDLPLYPHLLSTTFKPVPCDNHPFCGRNKCTADGNCAYKVEYGIGTEEGPATYGIVAEEKFTLSSNTGVLEVINLHFGCGFFQENFGSFGNNYKVGKPDLIAGILGLGPGQQSFVNQLGVAGERKFAYCLETFNENIEGSNTYLRFGADATIIGREGQIVRTTPIVVPAFETYFYYLNLEDISVGGKRARYPRSSFKLSSQGEGGTVIDSGTRFSWMYTDHFDILAEMVTAHLNRLGFRIHSYETFEVCFTINGNFDIQNLPSITLRFQQAIYDISDNKANFLMVSHGTFCLGILRQQSNTPAFILGAMQQANKRILYDLNEQSLSFTTESCELDNAI